MFVVKEEWLDHPKTRATTKDGRTLWVAAGVQCAKGRTEGIALPLLVRDAAYLSEVDDAKTAAESLVESGLWHDAKTIRRCGHECAEVVRKVMKALPAGGYFFHDWFEHQKTDFSTVGMLIERAHKQLLRNRELCEAIIVRDENRCVYCDEQVDFKDRKGRLGGTYDHVDDKLLDAPLFVARNHIDNVAVACRFHNGHKRNRTPAEADLPDPRDASGVIQPRAKRLLERDQVAARSGLERNLNGVRSDLGDPSRTRATADTARSGQDGSRAVPGQDQAPARSELDHGQIAAEPTEDADVLTLPAKQEVPL